MNFRDDIRGLYSLGFRVYIGAPLQFCHRFDTQV